MNLQDPCSWFHQIADDFSGGRLTGTDLNRAQEHMFLCESCLTRFESLMVVVPSNLTENVLNLTQSTGCEQAQFQMTAHLDESLDDLQAALFTAHVDHCGDCYDVLQVMIRLGETLPTMQELEPPSQFVHQVLLKTSRAESQLPWVERWKRGFQRLVERPRFALEAAYVLSLFVFLSLQLSTKFKSPLQASQKSLHAFSQQLQESQEQLGISLGQFGQRTVQGSSQILANSFEDVGSMVQKATQVIPDQSPVHFLHQKLHNAKKQLNTDPYKSSPSSQGESYE